MVWANLAMCPRKKHVTLHPLQTVGLAAGRWCPYGVGGDQPMDQRFEEAGQLVFDFAPLVRDIEISVPGPRMRVASDQPDALIAATLCENSDRRQCPAHHLWCAQSHPSQQPVKAGSRSSPAFRST